MNTTLPASATATPVPAPAPAALGLRPQPFRAMLLKTLRETMLVVLGMWGIHALILFFCIYQNTNHFTVPFTHTYTLMNPFVLGWSAIACSLGGFVLAIAQYRSVNSFDQWALLVHRPISRSRLFVLSIASGLSIYSVMILLPLFILFEWTLASNDMLNFSWAFFYPWIINFLTGVAVYLCGVLLSQRKAHWMATATIPLMGALLIFIASVMVPLFSTALLLDVMAIAIFATAAWGAALYHGNYDRTPKVARAGLILSLGLGCLFAGFVISAVSEGMLQSASSSNDPWDSITTFEVAYPMPLANGTMALRISKLVRQGREYRTVSGGTFSLTGEPPSDAQPMTFKGGGSVGYKYGSSAPASYRDLASISWTKSEESHAPPLESKYLATNGERIERVGEFLESKPPQDYVWTQSALYIYDRNTNKLLATLPWKRHAGDFRGSISQSTDGQYYFVSLYHRQHPHNLSEVRSLLSRDHVGDHDWVLYDRSGKLLSAYSYKDIPLLAKYPGSFDPYFGSPSIKSTLFIAGVGHGFGMMLSALPLGPLMGNDWGIGDEFDPIDRFWNRYSFAGTVTASLLAAVSLLILARMYRLRWAVTAAWVVAGVLLGPLMILILVGFHTYPRRVRCAACGKGRPVGEALCPHCGKAFPVPAANGTEIFV